MEVGSGFALSNIGKEMTELLAKKFGLELGLTYAIPKGGGVASGFTLSTGLYYTEDSPKEVSAQSVKKRLSY